MRIKWKGSLIKFTKPATCKSTQVIEYWILGENVASGCWYKLVVKSNTNIRPQVAFDFKIGTYFRLEISHLQAILLTLKVSVAYLG